MNRLPSDELILLALAATIITENIKNRKRKRTKWSTDRLLKRQKTSHCNLLSELQLKPEEWFNCLGLSHDIYLELLSLVTPHIQRKNTIMRQAISPHERLLATLCYLATGMAYNDLSLSTTISASALSLMIPETSAAICKVLQQYIKFPASENEWKAIAKGFEERWNFPNCIGAVDGKHVMIIPPKSSASLFHNYKGFHSLVLIAVVNANYEFIVCDFGVKGHISDGRAIDDTLFYKKLCNEELKLPNPQPPRNHSTTLPFVFVGDEAFTLRKDFLKPFYQKELNHSKKIFNYRLSRAQQVVENVFGILSRRFKIYNSPINLKLKNIESIVMATCYLHNFLRKKSNNYLESEEERTAEENLNQYVHLKRNPNRKSTDEARQVREKFMTFFNTEGAVPCQENSVV